MQTTEEGTTQKLSAADAAKAAAQAEPGQEPLESNQWDLRAIKADQAHKINDGSPDVTVGVIDTGVDDTHPDLAANFSKSQSANCVGGVADTTDGAWRPYPDGSDHGTHVAGTIAAPRNGIGVSGVAPGVKVAGIKVSEPGTSLFFTEAVVCGFMFAAEKGIEVTNNSYYVDPWMFNCKTDDDQKALVESLTRATRYAERKGVLNVAAAGNENFDLAADSILDETSPDDATPGSAPSTPRSAWTCPRSCPASSRSARPATRACARTTPATASASSTSPHPAATSGRSRPPPTPTAGCCPPCRAAATATSRAPRWPPRTSRASRP